MQDGTKQMPKRKCTHSRLNLWEPCCHRGHQSKSKGWRMLTMVCNARSPRTLGTSRQPGVIRTKSTTIKGSNCQRKATKMETKSTNSLSAKAASPVNWISSSTAIIYRSKIIVISLRAASRQRSARTKPNTNWIKAICYSSMWLRRKNSRSQMLNSRAFFHLSTPLSNQLVPLASLA